MNIAVIGPTYPYKGGISHFTTLLVQHLREKHPVTFISWKEQYPAFLYPVELKDTQSKEPIKTEAEFILDYRNPFSWIKAVKRIKESKAEKVILTWVSPIQAPIYAVIASLIKKRTSTKVMYICHNVLPHESSLIDKPLALLALRQGDEFIVHSKQDKAILEKLVRNKKIILGFLPIFNMFNRDKKYDVLNVKKELGLRKKVLLFFGYIRPYKGLKYLIKAMPDILKEYPDTSLLVAGDFWSKDKQSYFDLVDELGLQKDIVFVSKYIPNEEVGKYFAISDIAVFPYTSATQSATIQVAKAFNTPIICTSVGGLREVIQDATSEYSIKIKDSKDITKKVLRYYKERKYIKPKNISKTKYDFFEYITLFT